MPTYAYKCDACEKKHEEFRFMYEEGPDKCPSCGAAEPAFRRDYTGCQVIGLVKGQPTTVGQQAEINAKRVGKEQMQKMAEAEQERISNFTGSLPAGARSISGTGETPPWRDGSFGTKPLDKPLDLNKVKNIKKYIETGATS